MFLGVCTQMLVEAFIPRKKNTFSSVCVLLATCFVYLLPTFSCYHSLSLLFVIISVSFVILFLLFVIIFLLFVILFLLFVILFLFCLWFSLFRMWFSFFFVCDSLSFVRDSLFCLWFSFLFNLFFLLLKETKRLFVKETWYQQFF